MTTLLQRCEVVTAKIQQLTLAKRHANQQRLVQERTREWKNRHDKLKAMDARASCLKLGADTMRSVAEKRAQLRHSAAQVLERLTANDDMSQLTEDASWTRLLASVEGLAEEVEAAAKVAWRAYVEELGTLEDPAWLRNRAPSTPMNDAAISAYQSQYGAYASLVRQMLPRSADDLAQVSQLVAACRAEAAKVSLDVPLDVQRFFQAIQSGSATLATLTPGVLEWLAENGQLERYRIRSSGP